MFFFVNSNYQQLSSNLKKLIFDNCRYIALNYSQANQLRSFCSRERGRGGSKSKNAGREFHLISIAKIRNFGGTLSVFVCFSQLLSV